MYVYAFNYISIYNIHKITKFKILLKINILLQLSCSKSVLLQHFFFLKFKSKSKNKSVVCKLKDFRNQRKLLSND